MLEWIDTHVAEAIAWTIIHSLWQGIVIACLLLLVARMGYFQAQEHAYALYTGALATLFLCSAGTFIMLYTTGSSASLTAAVEMPWANPPGQTGTAESGWWSLYWKEVIALCWAAGTLLCALRFAYGTTQVMRLRRHAEPAAPQWRERLRYLVKKLGIVQNVRLLTTNQGNVPFVFGVLRPVIIFPSVYFTQLTPAQFESILLHELAHIRRHDFLINILQVVVESLLFFNPAIWWLSSRIRMHREFCCDDYVQSRVQSRKAYLEALYHVAQMSCGGTGVQGTGVQGTKVQVGGAAGDPDRRRSVGGARVQGTGVQGTRVQGISRSETEIPTERSERREVQGIAIKNPQSTISNQESRIKNQQSPTGVVALFHNNSELIMRVKRMLNQPHTRTSLRPLITGGIGALLVFCLFSFEQAGREVDPVELHPLDQVEELAEVPLLPAMQSPELPGEMRSPEGLQTRLTALDEIDTEIGKPLPSPAYMTARDTIPEEKEARIAELEAKMQAKELEMEALAQKMEQAMEQDLEVKLAEMEVVAARLEKMHEEREAEFEAQFENSEEMRRMEELAQRLEEKMEQVELQADEQIDHEALEQMERRLEERAREFESMRDSIPPEDLARFEKEMQEEIRARQEELMQPIRDRVNEQVAALRDPEIRKIHEEMAGLQQRLSESHERLMMKRNPEMQELQKQLREMEVHLREKVTPIQEQYAEQAQEMRALAEEMRDLQKEMHEKEQKQERQEKDKQ